MSQLPRQQVALALRSKIEPIVATMRKADLIWRPAATASEDLVKFLTTQQPWAEHMDYVDAHVHTFMWLVEHGPANGAINSDGVEVLSDRQNADLVDGLTAELLSFPKTYYFFFELPSVDEFDVDEFDLFCDVAIVKVRDDDMRFPVYARQERNLLLAAALGNKKTRMLRPGSVYLRVTGKGFATESTQSTAAAEAISKVKQILRLCEIHAAGLVEATMDRVQKRDAEAIAWEPTDPTADHQRIHTLAVTPEFSKVLSSRVILLDKLVTALFGLGRERHESPSAALREALAPHVKLLDSGRNRKDAERIHAGLEWSFDSRATHNETQAFIQACIGIEALLGDDDQERGLTALLADRCSFLLGTTSSQRTAIASQFRQIYRVRSQLVHGRRKRISLDERATLWALSGILDDVLRRETTMFSREGVE